MVIGSQGINPTSRDDFYAMFCNLYIDIYHRYQYNYSPPNSAPAFRP